MAALVEAAPPAAGQAKDVGSSGLLPVLLLADALVGLAGTPLKLAAAAGQLVRDIGPRAEPLLVLPLLQLEVMCGSKFEVSVECEMRGKSWP